ncbi:hypothetical protein NEF87_001310 [Candidatus Lokiarchaeum ossiferum]|uniref:Beta-hexosaminidase bacterial type N-terminal domain-containing protein n=1 Tax=Candidatus Lokiarchaeum ossiferum TaxID=2951803 RepID=A0ABY6HNE2_9ARCH|nr:hypothetical protein NEF87_001310 [Candidatus Lokiarchaeum sp. B-35]
MGKIKVFIQGLNEPPLNFQLIDLNIPILPYPKFLHFNPHFLLLSDELTITLENIALTSQLKNQFEKEISISTSTILKFIENSPPIPASYLDPEQIPQIFHKHHSIHNEFLSPEILHQCYSIVVENRSILIEAFSKIGLFYALSSLSQLIHFNQHFWVIQSLQLFDYPSSQKRICSIPAKLPEFTQKAEIIRWLTYARRYKYNFVFVADNKISQDIQDLFSEMEFAEITLKSSHNSGNAESHYNWLCPIFDLAFYAVSYWNSQSVDMNKFQRAFILDFFGMNNTHLLWELMSLFLHLPNGFIYNRKNFQSLIEQKFGMQFQSLSRRHRKKIKKSCIVAAEMFPIVQKTLNKNKDVVQSFEDRLLSILSQINSGLRLSQIK